MLFFSFWHKKKTNLKTKSVFYEYVYNIVFTRLFAAFLVFISSFAVAFLHQGIVWQWDKTSNGNETVEKLVALGCDAPLAPKVMVKNKLETIMLHMIPSFGHIHRNLLLCPHYFHFLDIYNFSLNKCPWFFLILDICIKSP